MAPAPLTLLFLICTSFQHLSHCKRVSKILTARSFTFSFQPLPYLHRLVLRSLYSFCNSSSYIQQLSIFVYVGLSYNLIRVLRNHKRTIEPELSHQLKPICFIKSISVTHPDNIKIQVTLKLTVTSTTRLKSSPHPILYYVRSS